MVTHYKRSSLRTACGRHLGELETTVDPEEVTCKQCVKTVSVKRAGTEQRWRDQDTDLFIEQIRRKFKESSA